MKPFRRSDPARSVFVGNLNSHVTSDIIEELFTQGGPVTHVSMPADKDGKPKNYAFVEFEHPISVKYVSELFDGLLLCGQPLSVRPLNSHTDRSLDNGAHKRSFSSMNKSPYHYEVGNGDSRRRTPNFSGRGANRPCKLARR
ncbi:RNA-binding protein 7 [Thelohanellus kitauei]|uniref:RNA-binding protein 7 n=1 Tax=Thelohanellus kitauei TaxID=669202 RepID=A0A0C2M2X6_THEKT|nr:RNA-binding protein 7 [Thelohanellus kitauei]